MPPSKLAAKPPALDLKRPLLETSCVGEKANQLPLPGLAPFGAAAAFNAK